MTTLVEQQGCIKENAILKAENATLRIEKMLILKSNSSGLKGSFSAKRPRSSLIRTEEQLYFEGFDKIAPVEEKKLFLLMNVQREKPPVKIRSPYLQIFLLNVNL